MTLTTWREERRRKTVGALIASVVIHFLIILLVSAGFLAFRARVLRSRRPMEAPVRTDSLVAPPELRQPKHRPTSQTSESQHADKPA